MNRRPLTVWLLVIAAVSLTARCTSAAVITFDLLPGSHSDLLSQYAEAGFVVSPITGRWLQGLDSHVLGDPLPTIYGDTYTASLEISADSGALFSFDSMRITSGTLGKPVEYLVEGVASGSVVFSSGGQVLFPFETVNSPSTALIDTLRLSMVRLEAEGYVVDNIQLTAAVPEPASGLLWLGISLAAAVLRASWRGRGCG